MTLGITIVPIMGLSGAGFAHFIALACLIGGIAIIIVYNLLAAVPTFIFLVAITLCFALLFSRRIYGGGPRNKTYVSGLTTFLVLLGTSTMADTAASTNFYLPIAQILFAGLFAVAGLILAERLLGRGKFHRRVAS
jgi:hypothetical protein